MQLILASSTQQCHHAIDGRFERGCAQRQIVRHFGVASLYSRRIGCARALQVSAAVLPLSSAECVLDVASNGHAAGSAQTLRKETESIAAHPNIAELFLQPFLRREKDLLHKLQQLRHQPIQFQLRIRPPTVQCMVRPCRNTIATASIHNCLDSEPASGEGAEVW